MWVEPWPDGISAFVRRDIRELSLFPLCEEVMRRRVCKPEGRPYQKPTLLDLDLGLLAFATVEKLISVV